MLNHKKCSLQKGYTLLEVLVAIALAAFLSSIVYGAINISLQSWHASDKKQRILEERYTSWAFLQQSLSSAVFAKTSTQHKLKHWFYGESKKLSYVADISPYSGLGGLHLFKLFVQTNSDQTSRELVLNYLPVGEDDETQIQTIILATDIDRLKLRFYGKLNQYSTASWFPIWQSDTALPSIIKLDVTSQHTQAWPSMIIHPALADKISRYDNYQE